MTGHRVDDLHLRLRADSTVRENLRGAAEGFVAGILEAVGDRLESRWPGRLFFLPRLPLRWNIEDAELSDPSAIARYADEIAASFGDPKPLEAGAPAAGQDIVVFRNEAHWWACYLSAIAAGHELPAAYQELRGRGIGFASLASRGREFAMAVLSELAEAGTLARVAQSAGPEAVENLCAVLEILAAGPDLSARGSAHAELMERARSKPRDLPLGALKLIVYVEAVRMPGVSAAPGEVASLVSSVLAEVLSAVASPLSPTRPEPAPLPASAQGLHTQFGGVFYLLALAMELEIGEILWRACLPEGAILARCVAALLEGAGDRDPAAALFGGVTAGGAIGVSPQQQQEAAMALIGNCASALPRRSLAKLPEVALRMPALATGQALVASVRDGPFALFAWPAGDALEAALGIRAFLAAWPASAPRLAGAPPIAELEGYIRVRAVELAPANLFVPPAGPAPLSALIAQIAGTLCYLFAARAGFDAPNPAALVERYFAVPATIDLAPREMTVKLPLSRVEISLRRAGLDSDSGWIPWLRRTVRFVFEEEDGAARSGG